VNLLGDIAICCGTPMVTFEVCEWPPILMSVQAYPPLSLPTLKFGKDWSSTISDIECNMPIFVVLSQKLQYISPHNLLHYWTELYPISNVAVGSLLINIHKSEM